MGTWHTGSGWSPPHPGRCDDGRVPSPAGLDTGHHRKFWGRGETYAAFKITSFVGRSSTASFPSRRGFCAVMPNQWVSAERRHEAFKGSRYLTPVMALLLLGYPAVCRQHGHCVRSWQKCGCRIWRRERSCVFATTGRKSAGHSRADLMIASPFNAGSC